MTFEEAYARLPDRLKREADMAALDDLIDLVAANSKWTNTQVFIAFAKLIGTICGDGLGEPYHAGTRTLVPQKERMNDAQ